MSITVDSVITHTCQTPCSVLTLAFLGPPCSIAGKTHNSPTADDANALLCKNMAQLDEEDKNLPTSLISGLQ